MVCLCPGGGGRPARNRLTRIQGALRHPCCLKGGGSSDVVDPPGVAQVQQQLELTSGSSQALASTSKGGGVPVAMRAHRHENIKLRRRTRWESIVGASDDEAGRLTLPPQRQRHLVGACSCERGAGSCSSRSAWRSCSCCCARWRWRSTSRVSACRCARREGAHQKRGPRFRKVDRGSASAQQQVTVPWLAPCPSPGGHGPHGARLRTSQRRVAPARTCMLRVRAPQCLACQGARSTALRTSRTTSPRASGCWPAA